MSENVLAIIPARAGSKGLPGKCVAPLLGRPLIEFTIRHALAARRVSAVCVTTDSAEAADVARRFGVFVVDRPAALATDTAPVDAAMRHALEAYERDHPSFRADVIVLLYANVPIRAADIIDRAVEHLIRTGADSVRTVAPVGKTHPDWLHRLDGDRMTPFRPNLIHRRQDLEPLFFHDAAVVAVTRAALFTTPGGPDDHHAFFGRDRRAVIQAPEACVDIDSALDLRIAEALLAASNDFAGSPSHTMRIGRHEIGAPGRVFIIAEAGVNHDGDCGKARRLVEAAREAGADAVKFQAFSADRLAAPDAEACAYQQSHAGAISQQEMLRNLELSEGVFDELRRVAEESGLEFLATPFGVAEVEMLARLGAPAIKLASSDIVNVPLLRAAIRTGLPLILSTGAAELYEVDAAIARLSRAHAVMRFALLHCVSRYPTEIGGANLRAISTLVSRYGRPTGFSDHTSDVATGALAVAAGAVILEKHLTLDRDAAGPDHFFSLTPRDFAQYVAQARQAAAALGDGCIGCTEGQREVRRLARGSLIARTDIRRGEVLTEDMLDVQRPGDGIEAGQWDAVMGRVTARELSAGTRLNWDDIGGR